MHKIYWFSGTGNSYFLAREFSKHFTDSELVSIAQLERGEDVVFDSDFTGIFFPAYCSGIPNIVSKFLERVKAPEGGQGSRYVYAICSSGGVPGAALPIIEDTLAEHGINVNASFHIRMPSNYYPLTGPESPRQQEGIFRHAERALRIAAISIRKRRKTHPLRVFPIDTFIKFIAGRAVATLADSDKAFHLNDACDGCELCARVCPASNISLDKEGRPSWTGHCEQCMACLQWCPKAAIEFGKVRRTRYHHPEVKAEEIARPEIK